MRSAKFHMPCGAKSWAFIHNCNLVVLHSGLFDLFTCMTVCRSVWLKVDVPAVANEQS